MTAHHIRSADEFRLGRRLWVALAIATAAVLSACSIPVDDEPNRIDPEQLPPELTQTTTTTTTTTVAPTTPPSTDPDDTEPTTTTTTTQPNVPAIPVGLYYTISNSDDLLSFQRLLPGPVVTLQQIVVELESPVPELSSFNLQSSVSPGLIADLSFERSVLTVSLDRATFEGTADERKQRAIAQIVLTFTSFVTPDAGAVGSVRFVIDGEGIPVFVPATGANSEPGAELKFADFQPWIASTSTSVTTTTTTTAPPPPGTTVAPSSP